jgi:hypothetical protein
LARFFEDWGLTGFLEVAVAKLDGRMAILPDEETTYEE